MLFFCNQPYNSSFIVPCTQEEADTRVFLHLQDMSRQGIRSIKIRTVNTDVVVIAIALFSKLSLKELWIEFGTGNNKVFYPVHVICNNLGNEKCKALLFFHAFTGCDQVSYFNICKRKAAWKTWKSFPEVTDKFISLGDLPLKESVDLAFPIIERFYSTYVQKNNQCYHCREATS